MQNNDNIQKEVNSILNYQTQIKTIEQISPLNEIPAPINITEDKKNNNLLYLLGLIILVLLIAILAIFKNKIIGPLSYAECLKIDDATIQELEPRYCVTSKGKVFYENPEILNQESDNQPTPFDQTIVPGQETF